MNTEEKTILIVDDTVSNLDILVDLLQNYDVVEATSGVDALEIIHEEPIDIILLDIMMPDMDGYEVCRILKADKKTEKIPIIFITAKTDEESIEKAYEVGGIDYVTKPFKSKELLARINRELTIQELIQNLEKSQEELKILAETDPMTKLYNRRYFSTSSKLILDLAKREKSSLSTIMIDIDKFKNINDTYGHDVGDEVIITLADILVQNKRKSDICCRYGGEEFVILLPATNLEGAQIIAENMRSVVESTVIEIDSDQELKFTVSLGVSHVKVTAEKNIEPSLKRADIALYQAKQSGRNRACSSLDAV